MNKTTQKLILLGVLLLCVICVCGLSIGKSAFQSMIGPRPAGYGTPWYIKPEGPMPTPHEGYLIYPVDGKFIDEPYEYAREIECAPMGGYETIDVTTEFWRYVLEPAPDGGVSLTKFKYVTEGADSFWKPAVNKNYLDFEKGVTIPYELENGNPGFVHAGNCGGALIILK